MAETPNPPLSSRRGAAACPFDPHPELARRRAEEPVSATDTPAWLGQDIPTWLVTSYTDVRTVLRDPARFSSVRRNPEKPDEPLEAERSGRLLEHDPPEHTRLRGKLVDAFTVRGINAMRPRIEEIVEEHLDAMERTGPPCDLVTSFALPVPSMVICELLGVPYDDRTDFQRRTARLLDNTAPVTEFIAGMAEMNAYIGGLVAAHRTTPDESLLSRLVREHGDELSDEELTGIGALLLIAGHETTANMLSLGALLLLRHPDQLAAVRDDPDAVAPAVEEMLRYLSVVHAPMPRYATQDMEFGGRRIGAGDIVETSLAAANRDEGLVAGDPDRFDITRKPVAHVAFGHGPHQCIGQQLARLEMHLAFPALLRRFPGLRLAVPFEEVRYRRESTVFGVRELPVAW
ncbi:cytochrome P450 [Nocardiopsis mwathae]|uniref:Cytochrome P450 n=1 Tax=Nocardiopsis mwathae TaxID=1472723 RepID=A0A7X0D3E1_9ACTN|nr:cytochrome P450 [Nocardiopsis mwathae]MBB6170000.1 cytochrome P450 [Nocardiopsis mwathae]